MSLSRTLYHIRLNRRTNYVYVYAEKKNSAWIDGMYGEQSGEHYEKEEDAIHEMIQAQMSGDADDYYLYVKEV